MRRSCASRCGLCLRVWRGIRHERVGHESRGAQSLRLLLVDISGFVFALPFFCLHKMDGPCIESKKSLHRLYAPSPAFPPRVSGKHRSRTHLFEAVRSLLSRTFSGFVLARVGFFLLNERSFGSLLFSASSAACVVSGPERGDASCVESKGVSEGRRWCWEQRSSAPLSPAPAPSPAASSSSPSTTAAKQCSRGRRSEVDEGTVQLFGGERLERRTEQCQASPELRKVRPFCPLSRSATRSKKRRGGGIAIPLTEPNSALTDPNDVTPAQSQLSIAQDALLTPESVPLLPYARRHVQLDRDSPRWDRRRGRVEVDQRRDRAVEETGRPFA